MTEQIKLSDLQPDNHNANKGTERGRALLEKSLHQYGAGRSILLDKNGRIIAGNKTAQTAGEIGIDDVIIVRTKGDKLVAVMREDLDLSDDDTGARMLAYADNRVGQVDLEWDAEALLADMTAGMALDEFWFEDELKDIFADVPGYDNGAGEPSDAEPQTSKADELREKWGVEPGQLWRLPSRTPGQEHRLICGDCTDTAVVGRVMGGEKANLFLTDAPYGVSYADKNEWLNAVAKGNRIQMPIENDHAKIEDVARNIWLPSFSEALECCCDTASFYIFMPQGGDQMMMMMMMSEAGWMPRHELIWLKNNHVLGRADYNYKHEPILYGWKRKGTHKFHGGFQTSVIEFPKPQNSDLHPTTKPTGLIQHLIPNNTQAGDLIYEPFSGSGTTIIAAENLSRQCRAVEIAPGYVAVALQRYQDAFGITPELITEETAVPADG